MRIAFFLLTLASIASASASLSGNSEFTGDLYKELGKVRDDNIAVSPFSARRILSLTTEGARGESARELSEALHLPEPVDKIRLEFKSHQSELTTSDNHTTISNANKIYVSNDVQLDDGFKSIAEKYYHAEIEDIDFTDNAAAASEINGWVEEHTENRIQNLVNPGQVGEWTKILLVNTLFIKGGWMHPFSKNATTKKKFYTSEDTSVDVDMMHQKKLLRYYENTTLNAKFLELKYSGPEMSMVFILPNEIDGLPNLERKMYEVLAQQPLKEEEVVVEIPKFRIENHIRMIPLLKKLGVKRIFNPGEADLTGFSSNFKDVCVSDVVQKAYIDVDEAGTVAAPASSDGVNHWHPVRRSIEPQNYFIADHPFLYFIQSNGVIIFAGRYKQ